MDCIGVFAMMAGTTVSYLLAAVGGYAVACRRTTGSHLALRGPAPLRKLWKSPLAEDADSVNSCESDRAFAVKEVADRWDSNPRYVSGAQLWACRSTTPAPVLMCNRNCERGADPTEREPVDNGNNQARPPLKDPVKPRWALGHHLQRRSPEIGPQFKMFAQLQPQSTYTGEDFPFSASSLSRLVPPSTTVVKKSEKLNLSTNRKAHRGSPNLSGQ